MAKRGPGAAAPILVDMALLVGVFASILAKAASVGVCYGMSGDNLPSPSTVVSILRANGITSVRLYSPESSALSALAGTGISVVVGAPNDVLPTLASSQGAADKWIRQNIMAHPTVAFRYLVVGNEVAGREAQDIVPAMENVHSVLAAAGLRHIKVTTSISQGTIAVHTPPSAGEFTGEAKAFMRSVVPFLQRTGAPLLANLYPYFIYTFNTRSMDIGFPLFTSAKTEVQDGRFAYQNLFHVTVDALYTAVEKLGGPGVEVVVSETGWPSAGGVAATVENARTFNQNLVHHVLRGTPRRPRVIETYVFSLFNENKKQAGVEQHWGLFFPNAQRVYPISFTA